MDRSGSFRLLGAHNKTVAAGLLRSERSVSQTRLSLRGEGAPVKGAATGDAVLLGALKPIKRLKGANVVMSLVLSLNGFNTFNDYKDFYA